MQIRVYKTLKYRDVDVIIRNIGNIFEYLFIWEGKIYSSHIRVKIPFWRIFDKDKYKDEEVKGAINLIYITAKTTIDELIKKRFSQNC